MCVIEMIHVSNYFWSFSAFILVPIVGIFFVRAEYKEQNKIKITTEFNEKYL